MAPALYCYFPETKQCCIMLPSVFCQLFSPHAFSIRDRTTAVAGVTVSVLYVQEASQTVTEDHLVTSILAMSQFSTLLKSPKHIAKQILSQFILHAILFFLLLKGVLTTLKFRTCINWSLGPCGFLINLYEYVV